MCLGRDYLLTLFSLQAYLGAAWMIMIVFCYGYTSFAPFSVSDFFIFYTLLLVGKSSQIPSPLLSSPPHTYSTTRNPLLTSLPTTAPVTFFSWKLIKRTRLLKPMEVDLVWERITIDNYELTFMDPRTLSGERCWAR